MRAVHTVMNRTVKTSPIIADVFSANFKGPGSLNCKKTTSAFSVRAHVHLLPKSYSSTQDLPRDTVHVLHMSAFVPIGNVSKSRFYTIIFPLHTLSVHEYMSHVDTDERGQGAYSYTLSTFCNTHCKKS